MTWIYISFWSVYIKGSTVRIGEDYTLTVELDSVHIFDSRPITGTVGGVEKLADQ